MAFRLFRRSRETQTEHQHGDGPFSVDGHEPLSRDGRLTHADESGLYATGPSIIDHVPWGEYLPEHQCILLDDGISVGAVYELTPVGTEGRPESRLEEIRDVVENALQDSIPELDSHQWVVQFFCQDDSDLSAYMDSIRAYVRPRAQGTAFTEAWLNEQERHLKNVAAEKGLFVDETVTGAPWRGQIRRTRMVVYRWVEKPYRDPMAPEVLLNQVCGRLTSAMSGAGIRSIRQNGEQIHNWLLRWFNPAPQWTDKATLNSFGLYGDYCASLGLSVHRVSIKPGKVVSLAPFGDSHLLMKAKADELLISEEDLPETDDEDDEDGERDVLGEMEIAARLMITGGEAPEESRMTRADRGMIREAIMNAARKVYAESRQMLPEDLMFALQDIAHDVSQGDDGREKRTPARRSRAEEMSEALRMFTEGFEGELFNRPGTPWPEADVTIVDLGQLAREGYEAQMAVAVISLLNTINNIAERDQYLDRDIIVPIDEGHIVTTNPLLGPYATKIAKMWRKLGTWLWIFTQNLADFPDTSKKMLNMAEWWICLVMPPEEVEQIARFKTLNDEQKAMLLSATKLPRKYTEGVILSRKVQALFRAVPPSLYLALGMTEKEEKAERRAIMDEFNCTELEAVYHVARRLDESRGLIHRQGIL